MTSIDNKHHFITSGHNKLNRYYLSEDAKHAVFLKVDTIENKFLIIKL